MAQAKFNPPQGRMPVLQFMPPAELAIDPGYQRSIDGSESQTLIRKIAQDWNWDLCLPLIVARRSTALLLENDGHAPASGSGAVGQTYYVIDGQHRLEAARRRGDIAQLPCVVVEYASASDEAASFVRLNEQRRPLTAMDLFKAAVASEDARAVAIERAMADAGLSLAPHSNHTAWKPGMVSNIGGIQREWRRWGGPVVSEALNVLATAFEGEVLQYAGTIFPGIVAVCRDEVSEDGKFDEGRFAVFTARLAERGQQVLREDITMARALDSSLGNQAASAFVCKAVFAGTSTLPAAKDDSDKARQIAALADERDGWIWCEQCDRRVSPEKARGCGDNFCSLRKAA